MRTLYVRLAPLAIAAFLCSAKPLCPQIIATVTDQTCTEYEGQNCNGISSQGCNSTGFSVLSSGYYQLKASIDECGVTLGCPQCLSVAYVYQQGATSYEACIHNSCDGSCSNQTVSVYLESGINYILYSCKLDCDGDCDDCPAGCTARATVSNFP